MKGFKSIFLLATFILTQNAFAESWARFTCSKDSDEGPNAAVAEKLIFDIGDPEEGRPLLAFSINGQDLAPMVKQYQFVIDPSNYKITSHMVWVEKIDPVQDSKNSDFNRLLSVAQVETKTSVSSGIETRSYSITRLVTNVDAAIPENESFRSTFTCEEPEIF